MLFEVELSDYKVQIIILKSVIFCPLINKIIIPSRFIVKKGAVTCNSTFIQSQEGFLG